MHLRESDRVVLPVQTPGSSSILAWSWKPKGGCGRWLVHVAALVVVRTTTGSGSKRGRKHPNNTATTDDRCGSFLVLSR